MLQCKECHARFDDTDLMRCPECGGYELEEATELPEAKTLHESSHDVVPTRMTTGFVEFDRSMDRDEWEDKHGVTHTSNYGPVRGSVMLLFAEPGVGKTTLCTHVLAALAASGGFGVLASGEEAIAQIQARNARLRASHERLWVTNESDADRLCELMQTGELDALVVDSIQKVTCLEGKGPPGSKSQILTGGNKLMAAAKAHDVFLILICHVTKDGDMSGPNELAHNVDTVSYLKKPSEGPLVVFGHRKNRYGSTGRAGLFTHTRHGLVPVSDTSNLLAEWHDPPITGSIATLVSMGERYAPLEIQALVVEQGEGRITAQGVDRAQLDTLLAVVGKFMPDLWDLRRADIFIQTEGNYPLEGRSAELALVLLVVATLRNRPTSHLCVSGRVQLAGTVKPAPFVEARVEALRDLPYTPMLPQESTSLREVVMGFLEEPR